MPHALVVVQDDDVRRRLADAIRTEAFTVSVADGVEDGLNSMKEEAPNLLLLDLCFADGNAGDLLKESRARGVSAAILVGSENGEKVDASLRDGVTGFLAAPFESDGLLPILDGVVQNMTTSEEIARERKRIEDGRFGGLVGASHPMKRLYSLLGRVAPSHASVFISGESGVGKEVVARTIHDLSPRRRERFLPVNCGAISATLMESELFGHEKGAFTGASRQHRGYFEQADQGTLFLDEITEMPLDLQVKLLRVLESGEVVRTGSEKPFRVDVRILAATNRVPDEAVDDGRLREDLYYRLRVLHIPVPPLRERLDDLDLLTRVLLSDISAREGVTKEGSEELLLALRDYDWPGNVRELRNALYTAYLLSDAGEVDPECLPLEVQGGGAPRAPGGAIHIPLGTSIREAERTLILTTLAHAEGRKTRAAEILGVSVKTLYNRLHEYGYMAEDAPDPEAA